MNTEIAKKFTAEEIVIVANAYYNKHGKAATTEQLEGKLLTIARKFNL